MMLTCTQSLLADSFGKVNNQKFLVDILLKYSGMDMSHLAQALSLSVDALYDIYAQHCCLAEEQANSLAQLVLMFLGRRLHRVTSLTH